jgi:hypothetical protein
MPSIPSTSSGYRLSLLPHKYNSLLTDSAAEYSPARILHILTSDIDSIKVGNGLPFYDAYPVPS